MGISTEIEDYEKWEAHIYRIILVHAVVYYPQIRERGGGRAVSREYLHSHNTGAYAPYYSAICRVCESGRYFHKKRMESSDVGMETSSWCCTFSLTSRGYLKPPLTNAQ